MRTLGEEKGGNKKNKEKKKQTKKKRVVRLLYCSPSTNNNNHLFNYVLPVSRVKTMLYGRSVKLFFGGSCPSA